jgi:hypothetical protein
MSKLQKFSMVGVGILLAFCVTPRATAQNPDRDRDWDREHERFTRIPSGMSVPVRLTESIDTDRRDDRRIYHAVVTEDIRGENGRLAIPRGVDAELMVRVAPDNDLVLDLEAINVNGQRYGVRSDPNRVESRRDNSLVGSIVGAISGGQVRGRAVRIPRDTVLSFRLERPLEIGVPQRRWDRDH